ncbi:MAG: hypothetical protein IH587_05845 [Anaerolineae bacterium]|nr:hypothetical protein [Anaerolineae bacterium]
MAKRKSKPQSGELTIYRFGFQIDDIHAAAKIIRPLLRNRWKRHNEEFWGGEYYLQTRKNGIIIKLHHNFEDYFDHWLQPNYKDYPSPPFHAISAGHKSTGPAGVVGEIQHGDPCRVHSAQQRCAGQQYDGLIFSRFFLCKVRNSATGTHK